MVFEKFPLNRGKWVLKKIYFSDIFTIFGVNTGIYGCFTTYLKKIRMLVNNSNNFFFKSKNNNLI